MIPVVEKSILWESSFAHVLRYSSSDSGFGSFTEPEAIGGVLGTPTTPAFKRALYKFTTSLTAGKSGTLGCLVGAGGKDDFTSRVP